MALFLDTRESLFPSFRESALRTSAPPAPLEPRVVTSSSSLLYPDNALFTGWRLRRRSSADSNMKRASPPTPYARPVSRDTTPPQQLPPLPHHQQQQQQSSVPITIKPMAISTIAPAFSYPTPPSESTPAPVHNFLEKYHQESPSPRVMYSKPLLSPPISPEMCAAEPIKVCISCRSSQSPCWRPSWSVSAGQLCNSCGLRYKKTGARCISSLCGKIPSKSEWSAMNKNAVPDAAGNLQYSCLQCNSAVELRLA